MLFRRLTAVLPALLLFAAGLMVASPASSQELDAKVVINASKIQGTDNSVFTTLETAISEFLNTRKWSNAQYSNKEKIACSFNFIVNEYANEGAFDCELMVQSNRPVFNTSYNTVVFNYKRIFPAVNIMASSTRRDDLLHDQDTLNRMWILRKYLSDMNPIEAMDFVKGRLEDTKSNEEFLLSMNS